MSRSHHRLQSLQRSLDNSGHGRATLEFAKMIAKGTGSQSVQCTIIRYYRTFLYEFPGATLSETVEHHIVHSGRNLKAVIVSDLIHYFEQTSERSPHYSIDVSLRAGVRRTYTKVLEHSNSQVISDFPLFLVIEESICLPPTTLDRGECFITNEYQDGVEIIEGGRPGKRALTLVKTADGAQPEFKASMEMVNVVLAAVKIEQDTTDPIKELYRCCCFVDEKGNAVYSLSPTMSARVSLISRLRESYIHDKAPRIERMIETMIGTSESDLHLKELFESLRLDATECDNTLRLWYLRLWQVVDDLKRFLDYPDLWNSPNTIAGKKTPKELKDYRNHIAHWWTGKMEFQYLVDLQRTTMELLRKKYQPHTVTTDHARGTIKGVEIRKGGE